jgi:hypothetical protein
MTPRRAARVASPCVSYTLATVLKTPQKSLQEMH